MADPTDPYAAAASSLGDTQEQPAPKVEADPYAAAASDYGAEQDQQTDIQTQALAYKAEHDKSDPARRGDVLRYAAATGLHPNFVETNLDAVKARADAAGVNWAEVAYRQPALVSMLVDNGAAVPAVKDDTADLGGIEWALGTPGKYINGRFVLPGPGAPEKAFTDAIGEQGVVARQFAEAIGLGSEANRQRIAELEGQYSGRDYGANNWFTKGVIATFSMGPYLIGDSLSRAAGGVVGGLFGGTGGAGAGGAAGAPAAGVGAAPGAVGGGAAGGIGGAVAGQFIGSALFNYYQQLGPIHARLSAMKDANGKPLDPSVIDAFSQSGAIMNGVLMAGFMGKVGGSLPFVKPVLDKIVGNTIEKALVEQTTAQIIKKGALQFGEHYATGVGMMAAQSAINSTVEEGAALDVAPDIAELVRSGQFGPAAYLGASHLDQPAAERIASKLGAATVDAVQSMWLISALGPGREMISDVGRAKASADSAMRLEAMTESAKASKLLERFPKGFQDFVKKTTAEEGAVKSVIHPIDDWNTYWQDQKIDPAEMAAHIMGDDGKAYAGVPAGGDLAIPVDAWLTKLGKTEHTTKLLDIAKVRPGESTPRQAKADQVALVARMEKVAEERKDEIDADKREISKLIVEQAVAAKIPKAEAEASAKLIVENAASMAVRLSVGEQKVTVREAAARGSLAALRFTGPNGETASEAVRQKLQMYLRPDSDALLGDRLEGMSNETRARELFIDSNTGLHNEKAFEELPAPADKPLVAHFSVEGVKYLNDTIGHDKTDLLYRAVAKALHSVDPSVAKVGGDFALHVADPAEAQRIADKARAALPEGLRGLALTVATGKTLAKAAEAHSVAKDAAIADGTRANPRPPGPDGVALPAERPKGLTNDIGTLAFPEDKPAVDVHPELSRRVASLSKIEHIEEAYRDKRTGLYSALGWAALPRKAHVAAVDLKGMRAKIAQIAEMTGSREAGEAHGDEMVDHFGRVARQLGGQGFDFARLHGDEFAAQHEDRAKLEQFLVRIEDALKELPIQVVDPTTGETRSEHVGFRYGLGERSYEAADLDLNRRKTQAAGALDDGRGRRSGSENLEGRGGSSDAPGAGEAGVPSEVKGAVLKQDTVTTIEGAPVRLFQPASDTKAPVRVDGKPAEAWRRSLPAASPDPSWTEAYRLGAEAQSLGLDLHSSEFERLAKDRFGYKTGDLLALDEDHTISAFFDAGFKNEPPPKWATGWRFGEVPTTKYGDARASYNFRDQRPERGVSLAHLDGVGDSSDGTFRIFNGAGKRTHVGGFLIDSTGSDGEPLLVGARRLTPKAREAPDAGARQEADSASDGAPVKLLAGDPKTPRGEIQLQLDPNGRPRAFNVSIFNGDKSTLLHETAHFLSWSLHDIATSDIATPELKADYATLLKFAGFDSPEARLENNLKHRDLGARENRTPADDAYLRKLAAGEEKISHGFEAYMLEGKAPSAALARVFSRFRGWLLRIYKGMAGIQSQYEANYGEPLEVSDDVRGVFDRMLADDQAIKQARRDSGTPEGPDPLITVMTEAEARRHNQAGADAQAQAERELAARAAEVRNDDVTATRAWVTKEVTKDVDSQPVNAAMRYLQHGEVPDGEGGALPELPAPLRDPVTGLPFKIDPAKFVAEYGESVAALMPPSIFSKVKGGGVDVENLAPLLGFNDGAGLVEALRTAEPRDRNIAKQVQDRLDAEYGPALQANASAAMDAIHSDAAARATIDVLRAMARDIDPDSARRARTIDLDTLKATAERLIGSQKVGELDPDRYAKTERSLAIKSAMLWGKGKKEEAYTLRENRLFNQLLYRAARDAQDRLDKTEARLSDIGDSARARMGLADPSYRDAHDALMQAVGLRDGDAPAGALEPMLEKAAADAADVDLDVDAMRALLAKPVPWAELTVDQAAAVESASTNIRHISGDQLDVILEGKRKAKADYLKELIARVTESRPPQPRDSFSKALATMGEKGRHLRRGAQTTLENMETWAHMLDGGKDGPARRLFVDGQREARDREVVLEKKVLDVIREKWANVPKSIRKLKNQMVDVTGVLTIPDDFKPTMARSDLWMLFLNWGNEGNRQRVRDGNGWSDEGVQKALNLLTHPEAEFLQGVLDAVNSLGPEVQAAHERRTGLKLDMVKASPITVNGVEHAGGYFALKYDSRGNASERIKEGKDIRDMFTSAYVSATTTKGHTKARLDKVNRAVDLSWGNVQQHLSQVIHDLAYGDWVRHAAGILTDKGSTVPGEERPSFTSVAEKFLGRERSSELMPWLGDVANSRVDSAAGHQSEFFRTVGSFAQGAVSRAIMGLNIASLARHTFDPYSMVADSESIGVHRVAASYLKVMNPANWGDPLYATSKALAFHESKMSDNMRTELGRIGSGNEVIHKIDAVLFAAHGWVHHFTARVCFRAAWDYYKAHGATDTEASKAADAVVERALPNGDIAEKPPILRQKNAIAGAAVFYSYASKMHNLRARSFDDAWRAWNSEEAQPVDKAAAIATVAAKWIAMGAVGAMGSYLAGRALKKSDKEDGAEWAAKEVLLSPLDDVAIAGPALKKVLTGHKPNVASAPALSFIESSLEKVGSALQESKGNKTAEEKAWLSAQVFLSSIGPANAVKKAIASRDDRNRNPLDTAAGVLYGPAKNRSISPLTQLSDLVEGR